MNPQLIATSVVAIATFALAPLSASAQTDPMPTVQQFIDARNRGDEPGAMALVADESLRSGIQTFISDHSQSALVGSPSIAGSSVRVRVETSNDAVRAAGLERIVYAYTLEVQDGKLSSLQGVLDATDAQTAAFLSRHLDMSPRVHDDWAVAPRRVTLVHHVSPREHDAGLAAAPDRSPRSRDDWAVTTPAPLDLSPASHDNWAL